MENLMLSYPISWFLVAAVSSAILFFLYRKLLNTQCNIATPWLGLHPCVPRGFRYLGGAK